MADTDDAKCPKCGSARKHTAYYGGGLERMETVEMFECGTLAEAAEEGELNQSDRCIAAVATRRVEELEADAKRYAVLRSMAKRNANGWYLSTPYIGGALREYATFDGAVDAEGSPAPQEGAKR